MMSENLTKELNKQMNYEFYSAQVYLAMASYCASENWDGFSNFFLVQAEEERFHAMKLFRFMNTMGQRATISEQDAPNNQYKSVLECFEEAYGHEQEVTKRIYKLSDMAISEKEHATTNFLQWFIDEQVEEEDTFDSTVAKLKRIDKDSNAMFMMDNEFAGRSFTPE